MSNLRLLFLILIVLFAFPALATDFKAALTPTYKPGELIVRYKDDTKGVKSLQAAKASSLHSFKRIKARHIRLPEGTTVVDALNQFRADPNVLYAEPNYRVRKLSTTPNDPLFGNQWNLTKISAPTAWSSYTGPAASHDSIIVAVLDTGVAYTHPDLQSNLWTNPGEICGDGIDNDSNGIVDDCYGASFKNSSDQVTGDPWDDDTTDSHGTHLSGIIGAVGNNGIGVSGINWKVRVMAVKFLHGPTGTGDLSDALSGVEYALSKGAKIINMSFEVEGESTALADAVNEADKAGALVVSAAGNNDLNLDNHTVYPASLRTPNNISVTASDRFDNLAVYANYGKNSVDLAAPGGQLTDRPGAILSTVYLGNGSLLYRTTAGTSMAAPHVTGAAALVWNRFPTLTHYQVRARILNSVDRLAAFAGTTISGGRLNLAQALSDLALTATPHTGTSPLTVTLVASSAQTYTTWEWDLGDGIFRSISNITDRLTHTFTSAGTFVVRVRANARDIASTTITVSAPAPSGGGGGGGCFIATAAWGSYLHPKVALLRAFRDHHLLTNGPGRLFVRVYYAVSPPLADVIARHESLRSITRWTLTPLIWAIEAPFISLMLLTALSAVLAARYIRRNHPS